MFAKFDEIPAMTLQDIKETKCYGRTDAERQRVNSIPSTKSEGGTPQTKFAGGGGGGG